MGNLAHFNAECGGKEKRVSHALEAKQLLMQRCGQPEPRKGMTLGKRRARHTHPEAKGRRHHDNQLAAGFQHAPNFTKGAGRGVGRVPADAAR